MMRRWIGVLDAAASLEALLSCASIERSVSSHCRYVDHRRALIANTR